jgi:arsenate reductase
MSDKTYNVLFICTHNSARSIMAEGLMNMLGMGKFKAYSAGSHPAPAVHPFALKTLRAMHVSPEGYRSKDWAGFSFDMCLRLTCPPISSTAILQA